MTAGPIAYSQVLPTVAPPTAEPLIIPAPIDLHSPNVKPTRAEFTVEGLFRRSGLHLVWAQPSGFKTFTLLRWAHELICTKTPTTLCGHPELAIHGGWGSVLWVATEETAGALRYRADMVMRGLANPQLAGKIFHAWAADPNGRLTLDHLPQLLDQHGPFCAVVLDSLTGLRPKSVDGRRIAWDLDNDAANETCLMLRGLAEVHRLAVILVHHTGRDVAKGYRGPTDWWASADVMLGLVPHDGTVKVQVDKNRDGRRVAPFDLEPDFTAAAGGESFTLRYVGDAVPKLRGSDQTVLTFLRGRVRASLRETMAETGLSRRTVQTALKRLSDKGEVARTDDNLNGSPVYRLAGGCA